MFCRIYVSLKNNGPNNLLFEIGGLLDKKPGTWDIETEEWSIYVDENEDFDEEKAKDFPGGFLFFPLNIEVEFQSDNLTDSVYLIDKILDYLWIQGHSAVPSSSIEHLLLEQGGYKSTRNPWPT